MNEMVRSDKRELLERAHKLIRDSEHLLTVLEDECLAGPLAQIFRALDESIEEAAEQMGRQQTPATDRLRQGAAQLERICVNWMLSRLEEI